MSAKDELEKVADEIKRLHNERAEFERDSIAHHREALKEFDVKIHNANHRKAEIATRYRRELRETPIKKPVKPPAEVLQTPTVKKK